MKGSNNGTDIRAKPNPVVVFTVDPKNVTTIKYIIKFVSNIILTLRHSEPVRDCVGLLVLYL